MPIPVSDLRDRRVFLKREAALTSKIVALVYRAETAERLLVTAARRVEKAERLLAAAEKLLDGYPGPLTDLVSRS